MGCACCCDKVSEEEIGIELRNTGSTDVILDILAKSLKSDKGVLSGTGFGRTRCKIDQDYAYFEILIVNTGRVGLGMCFDGISPDSTDSECFNGAEKLFGIYLSDLQNNSVVSVMLNQCARPNLTVFVNGDLASSVDRICCPSPCVAIYLFEGCKISPRFNPDQFTQKTKIDPSNISKPIIPSRNIV